MRKFIASFFLLTLLLGGISATAYASECAKDTPIDRFGDWFGNLGKKEKTKRRNIAVRQANRLAACKEKQAREEEEAFKKQAKI